MHDEAAVPSRLVHRAFVATPLIMDAAELDYTAYVASPDVIDVHSAGRWPRLGFTLDEGRRLAALHEADHLARRAFTFLLTDPGGTECLGCLYLNPLTAYLRRVGADPAVSTGWSEESAMVTFWIRQDRQASGLARSVAAAVEQWLLTAWSFETHLFRILPGEQSSRDAIERLDVRRVSLPLPTGEPPYLWYQPCGYEGDRRSAPPRGV